METDLSLKAILGGFFCRVKNIHTQIKRRIIRSVKQIRGINLRIVCVILPNDSIDDLVTRKKKNASNSKNSEQKAKNGTSILN